METNKLNSNLNDQTSESQQSGDAFFETQGRRSSKWLIIGLSAFSLFALGIAGVLAYQNYQLKNQISELGSIPKKQPTKLVQPTTTTQTSTPTSAPTIDPTINWKTYTNSKYGFTFKYPENWDFQELYSKTQNTIDYLQLTLAKKEYFDPVPKSRPHIMIDAVETTDRDKLSVYQNSEVVKNITVDGIETEERKHSASTVDSKYITFIANNVTYIFESRMHSQDQEQQDVLDQILSTFKFLN